MAEERVGTPRKEGRADRRRSMATLCVVLVIASCALAVYWGATDNEFIWDDPIIFNRQLPYFDSFENVFSPPKQIPQFGVHYYRPLIVVSYQIDEWISGKLWEQREREQARRIVYHSSVVLYHMLASVLVLLLGVRLARMSAFDEQLSLAVGGGGALLFALHPIHVESVAWMAGRSDVICGIFMVASLVTYLRYRDEGRWSDLLCAAGFAFGAMLSKETGVAILLIVVAMDLFVVPRKTGKMKPARGRTAARKGKVKGGQMHHGASRIYQRSRDEVPVERIVAPAWLRWVVFGLAWLAYATLRSQALNPGGLRGSGADLLALFAALGWYLRKGVWPGEQSAFVHALPGVGYAALGLALALAAAWVVWRLRRQGRGRGEAIALIVVFAALAPSLAIVVFRISETPLAERYLYVPTVGMCLLATLLLGRLARQLLGEPVQPSAQGRAVSGVAQPAFVLVLVFLIAFPAAYATTLREKVWQDDLAFWTDTVRKANDQGLPHLHLGLTYSRLHREDKALVQYQEALAKYDDAEGRSKAYNNMGTLFLNRGEVAKAAEALRGALREEPRYATATYNLGLCELRLAQDTRSSMRVREEHIRNALARFERALALNQRYVKAHLQYGRLLRRMGRQAEGEMHLREVIKLAPASREAESARAELAH